MKGLITLIICFGLALIGVIVVAGSMQNDEEYSDKQWSNTLLLEGKAPTIVSMLMSLPSEPLSVNGDGEVVVYDAYFWRVNDEGGNPSLGVLVQISDSQLITHSTVYNANRGKKK